MRDRSELALIVAMRQDKAAGMSQRAIAAKYGVTKGRVDWLVNRKGRKRPPSQLKLAMAERTERIVTLAMRGVNLKVVARREGVTYNAVWWMARRHGVRKATEVKRERTRAWLRRHEAGVSMAEIARSEGLPATTVRSAVERLRKIAGAEAGC